MHKAGNVLELRRKRPGWGIELRDEPFHNGDAAMETIAEL